MDQLKVGDVVELKSGGPSMTVTNLDPGFMGKAGHIQCDWFTDNKKEYAAFLPATLKKLPDEND